MVAEDETDEEAVVVGHGPPPLPADGRLGWGRLLCPLDVEESSKDSEAEFWSGTEEWLRPPFPLALEEDRRRLVVDSEIVALLVSVSFCSTPSN